VFIACICSCHSQSHLQIKPLSSLQTYSLSGWFETMLLYAYLPELTENEQQLNKFTRRFTVLSFGSTVVYLANCWWCRCTRLFSDKSTLDDEIGTARWHSPSPLASIHSYCRQPGVDFPATSTRSQSASWAINLDSWLSSSLQHDHQSLPKVSSGGFSWPYASATPRRMP
jgi:hypothetical protein